MKLKKKDLLEIIDANGELIGKNDTPANGSDLETAANGTTDMNVGKGQQPFRYDMLGRFGFTMTPFFEGKEDQMIGMGEIAKMMYQMYMETLEYYYRNPNKLKSDFRLLSNEETENPSEEQKKIEDYWANVMIKIIEPYLKKTESIDEGAVVEEKVVEDKIVDKKTESEIAKKSEDKGIKGKQIEKIAGIINKKLEKGDIDKLINLLERK